MGCCVSYTVLYNIEFIVLKTAAGPRVKTRERERERRERSDDVTQCVCAISRGHYRGYEINRCEEDQIGKRHGRYGDSGIIAHGGYVELSRETRTRGVRI